MRVYTMLFCATLLVAGETDATYAKNSFLSRASAKEQLQRFAKNRNRRGREQEEKTGKAQQRDQKQQSNAKSNRANQPNDPQFQPKPDLCLVYVIDQGNTARIFIQNRGQRRSTATTVKFHVTPIGPGKQIRRDYDLGPLEPNGTKFINVRGLPLSNVDLFALVDPFDKVQESNENNNIAMHRVDDQITKAADLAVTKIQFFPDKKQVWVTVHNYGRKVVRDAPIHLTAKFGLNTNERMRNRIKNLKPGTFQIFRFFPQQMLRGTQFVAEADLNNDLPEQNEGNNRKVATF